MSFKLGTCSHGLTDMVDIELETVIKDHKRNTKLTVYTYKCSQHGRHGTFKVPEALSPDLAQGAA